MHTIKHTIIFLLLSVSVMAQQSLGLEEAIATGLANNYQIQIAEQNNVIANNNNNLATAGKYPRITANLNSGNRFTVLNQPTLPQEIQGAESITLGLTPNVDLAWVLFDGYKVKINKSRLEQLEQLSMGNSKLVVENTINAIILAYYRAVIEQEKIGIFQDVLKLSKDRYDYEVSKRELGVGSTFNVLQVKDSYWNDSTNLLRQEIVYKAATRNLNLAMGIEEVETPYNLITKLELNVQEYELAPLKERMLTSNQNVKNQYINLQLLKKDIELQQSNKMPRVSMNTGANYNLSQFFINPPSVGQYIGQGVDNFDFYLNFSVSFNLWDAGQTDRTIQNAIVNEKIGELNIKDLQRSLSGQLATQLATYNDQAKIIMLNDEIIANAQQNLSLAEDRYKQGLINQFDYRNIQLAYLRASLTKLESIYSLKNTETEITRLIGGFLE